VGSTFALAPTFAKRGRMWATCERGTDAEEK
jgi:hypothetical protein